MTSAKTLFPESHSEVLGGRSSTHSGRPPSLRTCLPKPRVWLVTTVSISLLTLGLCSPVLSSSHSWLLSLSRLLSQKRSSRSLFSPFSREPGFRDRVGQRAGTPLASNPGALPYPSFHFSHLLPIPFKALGVLSLPVASFRASPHSRSTVISPECVFLLPHSSRSCLSSRTTLLLASRLFIDSRFIKCLLCARHDTSSCLALWPHFSQPVRSLPVLWRKSFPWLCFRMKFTFFVLWISLNAQPQPAFDLCLPQPTSLARPSWTHILLRHGTFAVTEMSLSLPGTLLVIFKDSVLM